MATARGSFADIRTHSSVCRPNGFATQDQSSKCRFPRSTLQTSPYDIRKTTKISTTCTYYWEILTVRALRSSRTIEYYVLLSLRIIEKQKDWIWIGFQSGPAFFVRTIENYVLLSVRTIEKWLYSNWTANKLVLWRHWMHLSYMLPMTSENQFYCTRLYNSLCCLVSNYVWSCISLDKNLRTRKRLGWIEVWD